MLLPPARFLLTMRTIYIYFNHRLQATVEGRNILDGILAASISGDNYSMSKFIKMKDILRSELKQIFCMLPNKPVTVLLYDHQQRIYQKSEATKQQYQSAMHTKSVSVQVEAIVGASIITANNGVLVLPRITIPFTANELEIWQTADLIHSTARTIIANDAMAASECNKTDNIPLKYEVGAVLATPRSCLRARYLVAQSSSISSKLQFVTFDTDNLTQLVWGLQRDRPWPMQISNPFNTIDQLVSKCDKTSLKL